MCDLILTGESAFSTMAYYFLCVYCEHRANAMSIDRLFRPVVGPCACVYYYCILHTYVYRTSTSSFVGKVFVEKK